MTKHHTHRFGALAAALLCAAASVPLASSAAQMATEGFVTNRINAAVAPKADAVRVIAATNTTVTAYTNLRWRCEWSGAILEPGPLDPYGGAAWQDSDGWRLECWPGERVAWVLLLPYEAEIRDAGNDLCATRLDFGSWGTTNLVLTRIGDLPVATNTYAAAYLDDLDAKADIVRVLQSPLPPVSSNDCWTCDWSDDVFTPGLWADSWLNRFGDIELAWSGVDNVMELYFALQHSKTFTIPNITAEAYAAAEMFDFGTWGTSNLVVRRVVRDPVLYASDMPAFTEPFDAAIKSNAADIARVGLNLDTKADIVTVAVERVVHDGVFLGAEFFPVEFMWDDGYKRLEYGDDAISIDGPDAYGEYSLWASRNGEDGIWLGSFFANSLEMCLPPSQDVVFGGELVRPDDMQADFRKIHLARSQDEVFASTNRVVYTGEYDEAIKSNSIARARHEARLDALDAQVADIAKRKADLISITYRDGDATNSYWTIAAIGLTLLPLGDTDPSHDYSMWTGDDRYGFRWRLQWEGEYREWQLEVTDPASYGLALSRDDGDPADGSVAFSEIHLAQRHWLHEHIPVATNVVQYVTWGVDDEDGRPFLDFTGGE